MLVRHRLHPACLFIHLFIYLYYYLRGPGLMLLACILWLGLPACQRTCHFKLTGEDQEGRHLPLSGRDQPLLAVFKACLLQRNAAHSVLLHLVQR